MATKQYAASVTIGGALQSSFKTAFGGASSAIKSLGQEVKNLSKQRADIRAFAKSSQHIDGLRQKLAEAKVEAKKAADALSAAAKPTGKLTREADTAARKVAALEKSIEGQVAALGTLEQKLNSAGIKTKNFGAKEEALTRRIDASARALRRHEKAKSDFSAARGRFGSVMGAGLVVGAAITAFIPAVKASNEFADTMVDIGKYVDGLDTSDKLAAFGEQIRDISRNSPLGAKGIADLVIGAGKLGMAAPEAMEFAKAMEVMAAGLDMSSEEAAETLTKIKSSMRQTVPEVLKLGDAMNYLGDVTASDSKNIADIMSRVGSTVKSDTNSSLNDAEIAAVAAQFDIAAPNPESAATAMKNFTKALSKGEAATNGNWWAYNQLGLDPIAMSKRMTTDAKGAINLTLERLGKLKPDKRAAVMSKLFGEESKGVIQNVIAAQDDLKKSLAAVGNESNFVGRSEQERQRNLEKFGTQLGLFKSKINDINISIGDVVKDAIGPLLKKTNDLLDKFFIWKKENPKIFRTVIQGTVACVALAAALVGAGLAITGLGVAWSGIATVFTGLGTVITAVGIGPLAVMVAAFAGAAAAVYKYWSPIKAFFHGVWMGIQDGWKSAGGLDGISDAFRKAADAVNEFLKPVDLSLDDFLKIEGTGQRVGKFIGETLVGFFNGAKDTVRDFGQAFREMGGFFGEAADQFKIQWEPVFNWFKDELTSLTDKLINFRGPGGNTQKAGVWNPAMSAGGAFMPSQSFRYYGKSSDVPEPAATFRKEGSEFKPNSVRVPRPKPLMLRGPTGREESSIPKMRGTGGNQINHFQINTQPGQSEEGIAQAVARVLRRQQQESARGSFYDGGEFAAV